MSNQSYIMKMLELKGKIYNAFNNNYHNDCIELNNNFIKVLKNNFQISIFRRFNARIMIYKDIIKIKKQPMHNCIDYINNYHFCVYTLFDNYLIFYDVTTVHGSALVPDPVTATSAFRFKTGRSAYKPSVLSANTLEAVVSQTADTVTTF